MWRTVGNKESKTQPIPSGSSLSVGILGKPKKREVKDEDVSDVVFVTSVVFSASIVIRHFDLQEHAVHITVTWEHV